MQLTPSKEEAPKVEEKASEAPKTTAVVTNTNTSGGRIFASPLAKKIAKDKGYNLADIKGSGENGTNRIRKM